MRKTNHSKLPFSMVTHRQCVSAHDLSIGGCEDKQTRATTLCFHIQLVISMDIILDLSLRRKAASQ